MESSKEHPTTTLHTGRSKKFEGRGIRTALVAIAVVAAAVGLASPAYARGGHGGSHGHGHGCYIAASGDCVQRPTRAPSRPPGATVQCADGAWSFSEHPSSSGTCHGHGGVS